MTASTAVGPCRHCRQPLEHSILRDEDDQPVDWYLGRDDRGVLDSTCYSPNAPARDCDMCAGTGGELGNPNAEWDCDSCQGSGRTTDHQPDLPVAIGRAGGDPLSPAAATFVLGPGGTAITPAAIRTPARWEVQYRDQQDRIRETTVTAVSAPDALAVARDLLGDQVSTVEGAWQVTL